MRSFGLLLALCFAGSTTIAEAQRDTIRADVDLVVVPASVKNANGKFVYDLSRNDFSILEDGRPQDISQFSIDPLPISATVLIDTGVGGKALRRFASSIVSLGSAFTEIDEAQVYRFDESVRKISEFTREPQALADSLGSIQRMAEGRGEGDPTPPVLFPGRGPRWLRWFLDRGNPKRALNEAMFMATLDLEKRRPETRKIVIVISDGQVAHDEFSLGTTRNRLAQSQIQVYGVTLGMAVVEGRTSVLHNYAGATGGDVYSGRTQNAMENAFLRITEQARHQYILGYVSNNEIAGDLPVMRTIEVRANREGLNLHHRRNYLQYPRR
jgi:VWFA-related protein